MNNQQEINRNVAVVVYFQKPYQYSCAKTVANHEIYK